MSPAFHGTVLAQAFIVDEALLGAAAARRRVLELWTPGATLHRTPLGLLVTLPRPRRLAVTECPGQPLVNAGGVLLGFPVDAATLRALAPPPGALVVQRGGQVQVQLVDGVALLSPSEWLDLGQVRVLPAAALGELSAPPLVAPPPPSLREALGDAVPPPAAEREALLREAEGEPAPGVAGHRGVGVRPSWLAWWRRWWPFGAAARRARAQAPGAVSAAGQPGWLHDWWRRARSSAARWLGLRRLLGRRHGQYLARFMSMLESGDVREGLRHAIPLEAMKKLAERQRRASSSWRLPSPRPSLRISPTGVQANSTLVLEGALYAQLRNLYRRTFDRLDAQGRHEEAAFVLAELLQSDEEAVAYLEKRGEFRRAAELAEARGCAAALIVRAWFLAGDRDRAVRIARQRGAFRDAITRLEGDHPKLARGLKLLWADALAAAGDYAGAVSVAHTLPEARPLMLRWLDLGLALDELQAPRLLSFQAALVPERWPQTRARAAAWLQADDDAAAGRRRALAEALPTVPGSAQVVRLARLCARAILAAAGDGIAALAPDTLKALLRTSGDGALESDLPRAAYQRGARWLTSGGVLTATIEARALVVVRDAAVLGSGRIVVAHGEAGVALLGPGGALLHRFDVPADRLVLSDGGDRALAVADRGEAKQLGHIDLGGRRAVAGGLLRLSRMTSSYNGSVWFVADGERVMALDVLTETPRCFWSVDLDEACESLLRTPQHLEAINGGFGAARWRYELPAITLRERTPLILGLMETDPGAPPDAMVIGFGAWPTMGGAVLGVALDVAAWQLRIALLGSPRRELRFALEVPREGFSADVASSGDFIALALSGGGQSEVRVYDNTLALRAHLRLPGAAEPGLRFCGPRLIVAASGGRIVMLDLARGSLQTLTAP